MKTHYVVIIIIAVGVMFYLASKDSSNWILGNKNDKNKPLIQGG